MKTLLALVFFVSLSQSAFAIIIDGGISGGGGNVINPKAPIAIQDVRAIRNIIVNSKELLKSFIEAKWVLYNSGSMDFDNHRMYSVLFFNDDLNLHKIMNLIKIHSPIDLPCTDSYGNTYDGSTFDAEDDSVCISAFNFAQKVDMTEVPIQAAALVMHEFSEVAGLSDEDAITIQKDVLEELRKW